MALVPLNELPLIEGGVSLLMVMVVSEEQFWKALLPISFTVAGRSTLGSWMQPLKASLPMLFRPLGKLTDWSEAHFSKAPSSMAFSAAGQSISASRLQPLKALLQMRFTVLGNSTLRRLPQLWNTLVSISSSRVLPVTLSRLEQSSKASSPRLFSALGR